MKIYSIAIANVGPNTFDIGAIDFKWHYGSDILRHWFPQCNVIFQFNNYKRKNGIQCDLYHVYSWYEITQEDIALLTMKYGTGIYLESVTS